MDEIESVSEIVDSGSCTCSDYNSDCSWFYDFIQGCLQLHL